VRRKPALRFSDPLAFFCIDFADSSWFTLFYL